MSSWGRPLTPDQGSEVISVHMYFESPEALKGRAGGFREFQGHMDPVVDCLAWSRVHFSVPAEVQDLRVVESHPDPHWAVALGQPQNAPRRLGRCLGSVSSFSPPPVRCGKEPVVKAFLWAHSPYWGW